MDKAIDPVCGMEVERTDTGPQVITDRYEYYFCSQDCFDLFIASPEDYIDMTPVDPEHPDETQGDRDPDYDSLYRGRRPIGADRREA